MWSDLATLKTRKSSPTNRFGVEIKKGKLKRTSFGIFSNLGKKKIKDNKLYSIEKTTDIEDPEKEVKKNPFRIFGRLSAKEQTHFAKRLSFLVQGGVPLLESLRLVRKQTKSKSKQKMFDTVIDDVSNGQFLSTSLARFKHVFGDFAINIIRIGETSGILSKNLNYLAEELKKKQILRQKVLGSLIYPIFITVATLGITGLLTIYIFPKIMPIFTSLRVTLPLTTRILISVSNFLIHFGIYLLLFIVIVGIIFTIFRIKIERFRYGIDWCLIKLPFIGKMMTGYNMTNFTRTMGLLLKSGVPVVEAVTITADTTTNRLYRKELYIIAENVTRGEQISKYLEDRIHFPDLLSNMLSIGEETGNLPDTLIYLSEMYEHDLDEMTKGLSSSIEPVLMVVMGLIVGLIAVSVITPIYEITQHLQH